jgi:hypothetical protein
MTHAARPVTVVRMFVRLALFPLPTGFCLPGAVAAASLAPLSSLLTADGARS